MIIFDLDGTLANCEHRRHFVDPSKDPKAWEYSHDDWRLLDKYGSPSIEKKWQPDWKSFYEACDYDTPIEQVCQIFDDLAVDNEIEIWSGRCESVREKTLKWLYDYVPYSSQNLRMRPIGDNTPDDQLKEEWLNQLLLTPRFDNFLFKGPEDRSVTLKNYTVDFVFDDRPKVIRMWRRRGVFVFNCCQHDEEF